MKIWFSVIVVCLFLTSCTAETTTSAPDVKEDFPTTYTITLSTPTNLIAITSENASDLIVPPDVIITAEITISDTTGGESVSALYDWRELPVIPTVSARAVSIYQQGLASGNDPTAFSKIGDGNISTTWFLTMFDQGPVFYDLGPNDELSAVIAQFSGSFGRVSFAARRGFNTTLLLKTSSVGTGECLGGENPLECELRLHKPSIAIISLGTNQIGEPETFEKEMRQILDLLVAHGVVPLLSTKADNREGDYSINRTIAQLAHEYEIPLWNFWRAIQPLPNHGLQEDNEHLTYADADFGDVHAMQAAWSVRNLTALLALDALWRGLDVEKDLP